MRSEIKVMVVEDDADLRRSLKELLILQSHLVETASDGVEALEKLECGFKPDVMLVDLHMEGMDGWKLSESMAEDDRRREIPIVIVSAFDSDAMPEHAVAHLVKPIDFPDLYRTIRYYAGKLPDRARKAD